MNEGDTVVGTSGWCMRQEQLKWFCLVHVQSFESFTLTTKVGTPYNFHTSEGDSLGLRTLMWSEIRGGRCHTEEPGTCIFVVVAEICFLLQFFLIFI